MTESCRFLKDKRDEVSFDHSYDDMTQPIKYNEVKFGKLTLKDDV